MSEKLKSTVENTVNTRELADLSREKAAEIERSLEKAVEKEKSNAEMKIALNMSYRNCHPPRKAARTKRI